MYHCYDCYKDVGSIDNTPWYTLGGFTAPLCQMCSVKRDLKALAEFLSEEIKS